MLMIDEKTIGLWSVALGDSGNWLALLARKDQGITLTYRFRWYRDDKVYDSKDKKNWYQVEAKSTSPERGIEITRKAFNDILHASVANKGWELLRGERNMEEFMAELVKMPGMHAKTVSEDQVKLK